MTYIYYDTNILNNITNNSCKEKSSAATDQKEGLGFTLADPCFTNVKPMLHEICVPKLYGMPSAKPMLQDSH